VLAVCLCMIPLALGAQSVYLVNDTLELDASTTEGHPDTFEWHITPPECTDPVEPIPTAQTHQVTLGTQGDWTIRLVARYLHEADGGGAYADDHEVVVSARSVVAELADPDSPIPVNESVVLDGSASRWSDEATPTAEWTIDGPSPCSECGDDLQCTIPADTLDPGVYTVTLTLSDPVFGDQDSDTTSFEMIDDTLTVDFGWTPKADPLELMFDAEFSPPTALLEWAYWNFGDGTGTIQYSCRYGLEYCLEIDHLYAEAGTYTVDLEIVTMGGDSTQRSHTVEVAGSSDPPVASFTVDPASPEVLQAATFTENGSCSGTCTYDWVFGDGTGSSGASVGHTYERDGTFAVELTVSDGSESDTAADTVTVLSCWTPAQPEVAGLLDPSRACWGDQLVATAQDGEAFLWSTGATTASVELPGADAQWLTADDGTGCWGTVDVSVIPTNCGSSSGDADLDGVVDASDAVALIAELTDGDGDLVVDSGGGDRCAPGGDGNLDESLTADDLTFCLATLFSEPAAR